MSLQLLERAAHALGDLRENVVFVGGATLVLWITDPGAPPPRPTIDVDVIVQVTTRPGLFAFDQALRDHGFREDIHGGIIGRWRYGAYLTLDAIPVNAALLGFENCWQQAALPHAITRTLPSGLQIRAVPPAGGAAVSRRERPWRRSDPGLYGASSTGAATTGGEGARGACCSSARRSTSHSRSAMCSRNVPSSTRRPSSSAARLTR